MSMSKYHDHTLLRKAKLENSEQAKQELYFKYENLIFKMATAYKSCGIDFDDLVAEGTVGFFYAIERFDLERDVKFNTYAVNWIRERILDAIKKSYRKVGVPYSKLSTITKLKKLSRDADLLGLSEEEKKMYLIKNLKITEEKLDELNKINYSLSNIQSIDDEGAEVIINLRSPDVENEVLANDLKSILKKSFEILTEEEKFIITSLYFENKTLKDLVSPEIDLYTCSKLKKQALKKLKHHLSQKKVSDYL
ncbi:RNA polymerase sigma factor, sigma-70 family protein [Clostridium argentinense CDC 2741]|uniref:RNA polymerase sigma factor, sigma-70 family protein n=3 Tax=Clostridium argentinense TaxID=29341 RepID=A0A0C1UBM0_9CLOT|nr:sigma-70 family RNA polymerase sigma factor [Clostridium argentinense]KIE44945.1 RNA polymerase sigma factor, sigma-70 family protein [Clostridium argentinense CDC 2741]ARC83112.1 hypothetical protein RSJ17_00220 [Clostridium argentinense]NFF41335.1 sigma-70 family RNA polymerase sigma factor [Clostridium argentinense]NFP51770.1 sigma-70 family RNA polymerase sigma factor [Clostridium argentinense]NFP74260.1 sigma-70 family RNA polymerase sigma factor [Clostridium argentinense]